MKRLLFILILTLTGVLSANDFYEMNVRYRHIEKAFDYLPRVRERSERFEELKTAIILYREQAQKVQTVADTMSCMDDIAFAKYADILYRNFVKNGYNRAEEESAKGSRLEAWNIPTEMLFELTESDIAELKSIHFNPNAKNKTIYSATLWPEYYQFRRFSKYYRIIGRKIKEYSQNFPWRSMFILRMKKMEICAQKLKDHLAQEYPEKLKQIDPVAETKTLLRYFMENQPDTLAKGATGNKTLSGIMSGSKSDSAKENRQDMYYALRKIDDLGRFLSKRFSEMDQDFEQREKQRIKEAAQKRNEKQEQVLQNAQKELKEEEKGTTEEAKEETSRQTPEKPLERMTQEALAKKLEDQRNQVFPAEEQSSLEAGQYEKCQATLSADQKEQLESFRLRRIRSGEPEQKAKLNALREIHPLLQSQKQDKRQLIEILKQTP